MKVSLLIIVLVCVLFTECIVGDDTFISSRVKAMYRGVCPWNGFNIGKTCAGIRPNGNRCNGVQPLRTGLGSGFARGIGALAPIFHHTYNDNNTYITVSGTMVDIPMEYNVTYYDINKAIYEFNSFTDLDAYYQYLYTSDIIGGFFLKGMSIEALLDSWFIHYRSTMSLSREMHIALKLEYKTIPKFNSEFNEIIAFIGENLDNIDVSKNSKGVKNMEDSKDVENIEEIMDEYYQYFGMDVITEAYIGVLSDQAVFMQQCNYAGINMDMQNMIRLYSTLYPDQYNIGQLNGKYSQYSSASLVDYYGGNIQVLDWPSRILTADDLPVLLKVKTMPITNFISNVTIRSMFEKYMNKVKVNNNATIEKYMEMKKQRWLEGQIVYFIHPNSALAYCINSANMKAGDFINEYEYEFCYIFTEIYFNYIPIGQYMNCQRLGDGSVVAKWTRGNYFVNLYGIDGVPTQSGCSIAQFPPMPGIYFYCCIDCTPVLTNNAMTVDCVHC